MTENHRKHRKHHRESRRRLNRILAYYGVQESKREKRRGDAWKKKKGRLNQLKSFLEYYDPDSWWKYAAVIFLLLIGLYFQEGDWHLPVAAVLTMLIMFASLYVFLTLGVVLVNKTRTGELDWRKVRNVAIWTGVLLSAVFVVGLPLKIVMPIVSVMALLTFLVILWTIF